jgi:hypothetical protein
LTVIVADDHALAGNAADAGDEAGAGDVVVVHSVRGELRNRKGAARIEQRLRARGAAAPRASPRARHVAALLDRRDALAHVGTSAAIASRLRANSGSRGFIFDSRIGIAALGSGGKRRAVSRARRPRGARPAR